MTIQVNETSTAVVVVQPPDAAVVEVGMAGPQGPAAPRKETLVIPDAPAAPAIDTDLYDVVRITALPGALSFTDNLTGTPEDGDKLRISVTSTGAVDLSWGDSFESSLVALPAVTVPGARLDVGFFWNADTSKWRCVGVS
jgi:hypothetical protein